MTTTFGILSLTLSIISALYVQLPTYILPLGYGWSHNHRTKRWVLRILALAAFALFINTNPTTGILFSIAIPFALFWIFSLFSATSNLLVAVDSKHIIKQRDRIYADNTEIVGYIDDNGNSICYPIDEMLLPRDILNDTFCDKPLLVSYCAGCRSAMIYNPVVDGRHLTFEVVGVYRRNMIMRDLQTGTIWQQAAGEAMYGPLKGKRLEFYSYQQTTLGAWMAQNPQTIIAKEADNAPGSIVSKPQLLDFLKKVTNSVVGPGKTDLGGLPLREKVWGLQLNGQSKAYSVSELKKVTNITDNLGGADIVINYNRDTNQIYGTNKKTNERLKFQNYWWLGWKEFHPDTQIWRSEI